MKILIEEEPRKEDKAIEGIEFDIRSEKVFIQVNEHYVTVDKNELRNILSLL